MGFYIISRYTSVAWFMLKDDADKACAKLNYRGGTHYKVVPDTGK